MEPPRPQPNITGKLQVRPNEPFSLKFTTDVDMSDFCEFVPPDNIGQLSMKYLLQNQSNSWENFPPRTDIYPDWQYRWAGTNNMRHCWIEISTAVPEDR